MAEISREIVNITGGLFELAFNHGRLFTSDRGELAQAAQSVDGLTLSIDTKGAYVRSHRYGVEYHNPLTGVSFSYNGFSELNISGEQALRRALEDVQGAQCSVNGG